MLCFMLYARDPADGGLYPRCPFRAMTGYDCPVCGTGRAMHELLHGRVGEALSFNVLSLIALPVVAYGVASLASTAVRGQPFPPIRLGRWGGWILLAVVLAFGVLRNLAVGAVGWMASYR
jgi:hypothetical protein